MSQPLGTLILVGTLAAAFFSSTFILNRAMSLAGGHWAWTGALRFGYMLILIPLWLLIRSGPASLRDTLRLFAARPLFWILSGTIGFGVFYSLLCFAASYAPGWVVASTWQSTIIATPLVLYFFGKPVPRRGIFLSFFIFFGILLINWEQASFISLSHILWGGLPVIVSAIAYPIGNQLVGEAKSGTHSRIEPITDPIMANPAARVLLMTLGSVPFWILLLLVAQPPPPTTGQWINTALVALSSGVIATSLFLHARHSATRAYEIAAVDATQAGEAVFALLGEILFLGGLLPGWGGTAGLLIIVLGVWLYSRKQVR